MIRFILKTLWVGTLLWIAFDVIAFGPGCRWINEKVAKLEKWVV